MSAAPQTKSFDLPRPFDIEIEQYVLGHLLARNDAVYKVGTFLHAIHFVEPLHQRIYDAIVRAVKGGQSASAFTLNTQFEDDPALQELGGARYLSNIAVQASQFPVPIENAAKHVFSLAFRRHLIQCARDIQDHAIAAPIEDGVDQVAQYAERMVNDAVNVASTAATERFATVATIAEQVVRNVTEPKPAPGILFGLTALDELIGGMREKELFIIGARPGMGKTAFAGHISLAAAKQGCGVAFFSMEMSAQAITLRLLTATAYDRGHNLAYEAARKGQLTADDQQALFVAESDLNPLPIWIHEGRSLTPSGILMAAKREQARANLTKHPLRLIIVDHIQKIRPERDMRGNRVAEMTEISDGLQKMAGQLGVTVIALSQLNRLVEGRTDKRPELSDLRESGSIEQDADTVLLLYREAYYVKKHEPARTSDEWPDWFAKWTNAKHKLEVHVAKQRNGSEGRCEVHFDAPSSALKDK